MEIKPKFDTSTINFSSIVVNKQINSKVKEDPKGKIPNGIYKVINWERITQFFWWGISILLFIFSIGLSLYYFYKFNPSWLTYLIPGSICLLSLYKIITLSIELSHLRKSITKYREDLNIGISSIPPFIVKIYLNLHKKQVSHNWMTFFIFFNGGIFTLLLWWLKDFSWWIFEFDKLVRSVFANPEFMILLSTILLITTAFLHVAFAIQRKRKIMEVNSFFGENIIPASEITILKDSKNKMYRRLFIIYLICIFIIPFVVKMILKVIRRKRV